MRIIVAHGADESVDGPKGRRKTDVQQVADVLRRAGYEVAGVAVDGTPECLRALAQAQADLVFNLVESFGDDDTKEPHVAAYYDLLGLRYTGSGVRGLTLAMDKALAKKIFSFHGLATPRWAVVWRGRLDSAHDIDFPVIVKPAREDGSIGIGFDALVGSIKELMERIDQLHAEFDDPVLIEQYIDQQAFNGFRSVMGPAGISLMDPQQDKGNQSEAARPFEPQTRPGLGRSCGWPIPVGGVGDTAVSPRLAACQSLIL